MNGLQEMLNSPAANAISVLAGIGWCVWYGIAASARKTEDPEYRHGVYGERLGRRDSK